MRSSLVVWLAAAALLFCAGPLSARSDPPAVDQDYVSALAAAGRFLHAWQAQDQENVILMLSDPLRQHTTEESLQQFLSAAAAPQAYEMDRGKKLAPGRYQFHVTLFSMPSGSRAKWIRPHLSHLVIVKSGKNDWVIDKLP